MWLFSRYGFYSVACANKPKGSVDVQALMIRARCADHLRNLQKRFPTLTGAKIVTFPARDYRYRLFVSKDVWASILSELAREQEWSNFKNEVARFQGAAGSDYTLVLHDVWRLMYGLQKDREGTDQIIRDSDDGTVNAVGLVAAKEPTILSLQELYRFIKDHASNPEALRLERTDLGRKYCRLCDQITNSIDETPGFYLWGRYGQKGGWQNIYLGKAGYGKTTNLKQRIREELKDERPSIWRAVLTENEVLAIGARIHPVMWEKRKYCEDWKRSMRKAGTTHIAWVPAPEIKSEDVTRIESDLIEALNPIANHVRPAPLSILQPDTTRILASFRSSVHAKRDSKFTIRCPQ
jgi:hypothetical protein